MGNEGDTLMDYATYIPLIGAGLVAVAVICLALLSLSANDRQDYYSRYRPRPRKQLIRSSNHQDRV